MGTSRPPDRSLGGGISFPQWMRGKVESRFDFDQGAFSPPSHDDSFFYIRYPKSANPPQQSQEGFRPINEVLSEQKPTSDNHASRTTAGAANISNIKNIKDIDFSKHPLPCQPFVPTANKEHEKQYTIQQKPLTKSQGTDDGFHGEPALCGKSIVNVASRLMLGSHAKKSDNHQDTSNMSEEEIRKGSRSLPVSPITSPTSTPEGSPKSRRRPHGNRYFTGAFIPDKEKYQGGWLLSSILSQSREIVGHRIEEEEEPIPPPRALSRKKSISTQNLSYIGKEETSPKKSIKEATVNFQAKPSELREMNFWSPTSM